MSVISIQLKYLTMDLAMRTGLQLVSVQYALDSIQVTCVRCSHCRDLESTWDALADELKGKVNVAKVH